MNVRARSIVTDVVLGLAIVGIHLLVRYSLGELASYVVTAILSFWVGYLRPGSSQANSFPQWMLINFWFFIYVPMGFNGANFAWMFLLASYGASGLGFLTNQLTQNALRWVSVGVAILLTLALVALGWWGETNGWFEAVASS